MLNYIFIFQYIIQNNVQKKSESLYKENLKSFLKKISFSCFERFRASCWQCKKFKSFLKGFMLKRFRINQIVNLELLMFST